MDDLISRQAAIDALDVLCQEHRYRIPGKRETYSQYNEAWQDALDRAEGAIGNLPSVQPEILACGEGELNVPDTNVGDMIHRQAAIDALRTHERKPSNKWVDNQLDIEWNNAIDICCYDIEDLPSAQPEPLSDAYMKSVWTWLLDYQIKAAELKGRYTPYEVLSWVANDWRKEHE